VGRQSSQHMDALYRSGGPARRQSASDPRHADSWVFTG